MAKGVDEAIGRFPVVLDMLGDERVSTMDGCNRENAACAISDLPGAAADRLANKVAMLFVHIVVDALIKDVFNQVCELTGYGEGTFDATKPGGKSLILDPTSGAPNCCESFARELIVLNLFLALRRGQWDQSSQLIEFILAFC
jgi:hypothetical protein